ncbi:hypothetical protein ACOMHN_012986 [Nucella lapillus]
MALAFVGGGELLCFHCFDILLVSSVFEFECKVVTSSFNHGRRNWPSSSYCSAQWSVSSTPLTYHDTGRSSSLTSYTPSSSSLSHGSSSSSPSGLSRGGSLSLDSGSRVYYQTGSDVMSRYSSRSLDVGSTRYDSGSSSSSSTYSKGLDPSSVGSYRSSNLGGYGSSHGYGSHGYSGRSGDSRSSSYSSSSASSSSASSGRLLHGSYSSRSSAVDSVPLPRSSSFGRSEVLSSSTPRDRVDKGSSSYSSSLGRSSSIPSHADDSRSTSRYSGRSSVLSTNHSLDSGTDAAAAERRLRLAQRRRQREERGYSETSSDNSKEPSVERASSLRRDSDSDSATVSSARARRLAARLQEASVIEEPSSKDSSPDVADSSLRRSMRLRGSSASSEEAGVPASTESGTVTERRSSLRQRRLQEEAAESSETTVTSRHSASEGKDTDRLTQMSAEARRARRQRRLEGLEVASRQVSGHHEEEADTTLTTSTAGSSRSVRQRLQEHGVSGVSAGDPEDSKTRVPKSLEVDQPKTTDAQTASKQDKESSPQRSWRRTSEERAEDSVADAVATEVESRAERIARYKEERRKQLAHIASITATPSIEEKEGDALPSLFISAKRDKEDSPTDGRRTSLSSDSGGAVSLSSRIRALRRGSQEADDAEITTDSHKDASATRVDTAKAVHSMEPQTPVLDQEGGSGKVKPVVHSEHQSPSVAVNITSKRQTERSSPSPSSQTSSTRKSSLSESSRQQKSSPLRPAGADASSASSAGTTASTRKASIGAREPSPRKTAATSDDVRSERKPQDSSAETRKSKSPSPVSSRLMAPTRSSAAKGVHSHTTTTTTTTSPRSSASPRGSPAPSDKQSLVRSASAAASTKGPPRIKQSLLPEHGSKDATSSKPVGKVRTSGEAGTVGQTDGRSTGRVPGSVHTEARDMGRKPKDRPSPQRQSSDGPKLSSSSFSTTSSSLSTDRDSGVGSARLSSSSFSSTRSHDQDTASSRMTTSFKASRLQRSARVELSSSSSREGSEEKQLGPTTTLAEKPSSFRTGAVRRATSFPSRTASADGGHQAKVSTSVHTQQTTTKSPASRERKPSSASYVEKEPTPPTVSVSISQKSRKDSVKREAPGEASEKPGQSTVSSESIQPASGVSAGAGMGLDDLLAQNAQFLSSDEDKSEAAKKERRKLREGEEAKLRRSLRRRRSQKSGSESRSSSERDSKDKGQKEGMEVAATPTLTLPTTASSFSSSQSAVVTEGEVLRVCPTPPYPPDKSQSSEAPSDRQRQPSFVRIPTTTAAAAASADGDSAQHDAKLGRRRQEGGGKEEEGGARRRGGGEGDSKEASPDSDSVFHSAPSAPSSVEVPRRRPQDKSQLRKSDLNKAPSSHPGQ